MTTKSSTKLISPSSKRYLEMQGYSCESIVKISEMAPGIRFAYICCGILIMAGLVTQSSSILIIAFMVATSSVVLPNIPFDYLYNISIRHIIGKPPMGPRSQRSKLICGIGATWLLATIFMLAYKYYIAAYVLGGIQLSIIATTSLSDFCIPSYIIQKLSVKS